MTQLNSLDATRGEPGGYQVDVSRGERIGRVSSEWFARPADERYLNLAALFADVERRAQRSRPRTIQSREIRVEACCDDAEALSLLLPGEEAALSTTHSSFGQLARLVGAP